MYLELESLRELHSEKIETTQREKDLLLLIRHRINFGSVTIEVKNGEPMFVTEVSKRELLG